MKKKNLSIIMMVMIVGLCLLGAVGFGSKADAAESPRTTINRLYNPNSGEHLFTPSDFERATLINFGWKDEGIGFYGQGYTTEKTSYVSRVYNPNAGDHHYTASNDEVQHLVKLAGMTITLDSICLSAGAASLSLIQSKCHSGCSSLYTAKK